MEILVIDTETTGLNGYPKDVVVEIGIALVDTSDMTVGPFFTSICGYDTSKWPLYKKNAWVFKNTDLTLDMVSNALPVDEVAEDLHSILEDIPFTAFNIDYDFSKFLDYSPWNLKGCKKVPDIMLIADKIKEIPRKFHHDGLAWPSAEATYNYLFGKSDPAGICGKEKHRALSDAIVEGHILLELYRRGLYPLDVSGGDEH